MMDHEALLVLLSNATRGQMLLATENAELKKKLAEHEPAESE